MSSQKRRRITTDDSDDEAHGEGDPFQPAFDPNHKSGDSDEDYVDNPDDNDDSDNEDGPNRNRIRPHLNRQQDDDVSDQGIAEDEGEGEGDVLFLINFPVLAFSPNPTSPLNH